MNVEEYFPEGLSVIHHDESQREGRTSNEDSHNLPTAIHCHICYKNISDPINNVDFIKPCNCRSMFVHTECAARNRKKFGEAKCSNCGQGSTIQRSAQLRRPNKVNSEISCCGENGPACMICNDKKYQYKPHQKNPVNDMACKIKPCFCRKLYHFGCLRPLIEERPLCSECKVIYSSFEPATPINFFMTKWIWYTLYIATLSILTTFFIVATRNSLIFTKMSSNHDDINKEIMLTILAVFFLVLIASTMFSVIKYTFWTALPTFKITNGKFILKPVQTASNPAKFSKRELDRLSEKDFEEIPLDEIRHEATGDKLVEAARSNDTDDMTLGQHMFGIYATHHSSSTPIDKPTLEFVFNSV